MMNPRTKETRVLLRKELDDLPRYVERIDAAYREGYNRGAAHIILLQEKVYLLEKELAGRRSAENSA